MLEESIKTRFINRLPGILPWSPICFVSILLAISAFGRYSIQVIAHASGYSSDADPLSGHMTKNMYRNII